MARRLVCLTAVLTLLGLWSSPAAAQTTRLAGVVTLGGFPVPTYRVMAFELTTGQQHDTSTGADGTYEFVALPYGSYRVQAMPDDRDYVWQFYSGADQPTAATPVTLSAQSPTATGIDFYLVQGSRISGRAWHDADGDRQYDPGENLAHPVLIGVTRSSDRLLASGQVWTAAGGAYVVHGVPNQVNGIMSYVVSALPVAPPGLEPALYGLQYFDGTSVLKLATTLGQATLPQTDINFPLALGATIGGLVRNASGQPLADLTICANDEGNDWSRCAPSQADGRYTITGLGPGRYWLFTNNAPEKGYWMQLFDHRLPVGFSPAGGTQVEVHAGQTVSGKDFDLIPAGGSAITGRMTDANGTPLDGIDVYAVEKDTREWKGLVSSRNGTYQVIGLPAGKWYLVTSNGYWWNFINQLYDGQDTGCSGCFLERGTWIEVLGAGDVADGKDFHLHTGGMITGRVTLNGIPTRAVEVKALNLSGNQTGGLTTSNSDGTYEIKGLPTGTYRVRTDGGRALGYLDEAYDNVPCDSCSYTTGAMVSVTANATTAGIDFDLAAQPVLPVVSSVQPSSGPVGGGQGVTIAGSGFQAGAAVMFGGTPAIVVSVSPTGIQVLTPGHLTGSVDVRVVNPDNGAETKAAGYTYLPCSDRFVAGTGWDRQGTLSNDCAWSGAPCRSVRQAITSAVSGDTVHVGTGTYSDGIINLTKRLTFLGRWAGVSPNDAGSPLLGNPNRVRAGESAFEGSLQFQAGSSGTVIDGMLFRARAASTFDETAISAGPGYDVDDVVVRNTVFSAVRGFAVYVSSVNDERWLVEDDRVEGIDARATSNTTFPAFYFRPDVTGGPGPIAPVVRRNVVVGTPSTTRLAGIQLDNATDATIAFNSVSGIVSTQRGISLSGGARIAVTGNSVSGGSYGIIAMVGGGGFDITHNALAPSGTGISVGAQTKVLTIGGIRIANNSVSGGTSLPIICSLNPATSSMISGLTIADNSVAMDVSKLTLAYSGIDVRFSANANHHDVSITGNRVTLTGAFPSAASKDVTAAHALKIRGNIPGAGDGTDALRVVDNVLVNVATGSTAPANPPGPPASAIFVETGPSSTTPVPPATAAVEVECNRLSGFLHGVSVHNSDALSLPTAGANARYGGWTPGATVTLRDNTFSGNTAAGVRTGSDAEPWIDARLNWWSGSASAGVGNVDVEPALPLRPVCGDPGAALSALAARIAALAGAATDAEDRARLAEAAAHLLASEDPTYWASGDAWVLDPDTGKEVFQLHKDALIDLVFVLDHGAGGLDPAELQSIVDAVGGFDAKLAAVAISRGGGEKPKQIKKAMEEMVKGCDRLATGRYESAIEHLRNAWQHALKG